MKWVLVWILITGPQSSEMIEIKRFDSMAECFIAREHILVRLDRYNGIPEVNTQYVCVRTNHK